MRAYELKEDWPGHERSRNIPFTEKELEQIHRMIKALEDRGRNSLSAKEIGFKGEMDYAGFMQHVGYEKRNAGYKKQTLQLNQIYAQDQDGVGIRNLKMVLDHWDTAPLPQVVLMDNGYYWLMEGHHRLALQRLAGRTEMLVLVDYKKKRSK